MGKLLITGTTKGIGYELAKTFLSEGRQVIGIGRSESSIEHKDYEHIQCDLLQVNELSTLLSVLKSEEIELFCHGAMYSPKHRPFLKVPVEDMLKSFSLGNIAGLEILKIIYTSLKRHKGSVVFLSSAITKNGAKGQIPYLAAKSSLEGLVKGLSLEMRKSEVRVNALLLGLVDTEKLRDNVSDGKLNEILDSLPSNTFLKVSEIGKRVDELFKDKFTSGECLMLGELPTLEVQK